MLMISNFKLCSVKNLLTINDFIVFLQACLEDFC